MRITVMEAMRIQKVLAENIRDFMSHERSVILGQYFGDDGTEINISNEPNLPGYIAELSNLFRLSEVLSDKLSKFTCESGVSRMVKERENLKVLQRMYESAIRNMPAEKTVTYQVVGNQRAKIETQFIPFWSKNKIKENLKTLKRKIRLLQSEIDKKNLEMVELPFEYEDIENLSISKE